MRWRNGLTVTVLMGPVLDEVDDTSILKTGRHARYRRSLIWSPRPRVGPRFSGLSRSDLVLWHCTEVAGLTDDVGSWG